MTESTERLIEYFVTVGIDPECVTELNGPELGVGADEEEEKAYVSKDAIFDVKIDTLCGSFGHLAVGYELVSHTLCKGHDACVRRKKKLSMSGVRSANHYLCISREPIDAKQLPISLVSLVSVKKKRLSGSVTSLDGMECVKLDDKHYLSLKRDPTMQAITGLCLIDMRSETVPFGFMPLPFRIGPHNLTVCVKTQIELRFETCILDRYPREDRCEEKPLSNTTSVFCQPSGAQVLFDTQPMPTFLSFVLTDANGMIMYAMTVTFFQEMDSDFVDKLPTRMLPLYPTSELKQWRAKLKSGADADVAAIAARRNFLKCFSSRSVCILSYHPFLEGFKECLKEIYRISCSRGSVPIEHYVHQLCEGVRIPQRDFSDTVVRYAHRSVRFHIPRSFELQSLYDEDTAAFEPLLKCLSVGSVILVVRALLTQEFKIVFHTRHPSLLTSVMQAALALISPFKWQFTYVPVLPINLLSTLVDAPVPMIIGIHSSNLRGSFFHPSKELLIVNVDCDHVYIPSLAGFDFLLADDDDDSSLLSMTALCPVRDMNEILLEIPDFLEEILRFELVHYAHVGNVKRYTQRELCFEGGTVGIGSAFAVAIPDDLEVADPFDGTEFRLAFLHLVVGLFGGGAPAYSDGLFNVRDFLLFPDDTLGIYSVTDMFDVNMFLHEITGTNADGSPATDFRGLSKGTLTTKQAKSLRCFWGAFAESQSFSNLIADLLVCGNDSTLQCVSDDRFAELTFFEKCLMAAGSDCMAIDECLDTVKRIAKGKDKRPFSPAIAGRKQTFRSWYYSQADGACKKSGKLKTKDIPPPTVGDHFADFEYDPLPNGGFPQLSDELFPKGDAAKVAFVASPETDAKAMTAERRLSLEKKLGVSVGRSSSFARHSRRQSMTPSMASRLTKSMNAVERAHHSLVQVCGAWLSVCLAYADNMFFENKAEAAAFAEDVLSVLFAMLSNGLKVDEMIFKSCLILCGKFGRHEDSLKVMRALKKSGIKAGPTTYGAYANAMASTQASYGGSALASAASSGSRRRFSSLRMTSASPKLGPADSSEMASAKATRVVPATFDAIDEEKSLSGIQLPPTALADRAQSIEAEEKCVSPPLAKSPESLDLETVDEETEMDKHSPTPPPAEDFFGARKSPAATLFDYSSLRIDSTQLCECGFVMSDCQVLNSWCEVAAASTGPASASSLGAAEAVAALCTVACPVCDQRLVPSLKIECTVSKMHLSHAEEGVVEHLAVAYISPFELRSQCAELIASHSRSLGLICEGDSEIFREQKPELFWNLVWYFGNRQPKANLKYAFPPLALRLILGELDASALRIGAVQCSEDCCRFPDDSSLSAAMDPIERALSAANVASALKLWLRQRQQCDAAQKNGSVWNLSIAVAFEQLNAASMFSSVKLYRSVLSTACMAVRARSNDCLPSKDALAFDEVFQHPFTGAVHSRLAKFSL